MDDRPLGAEQALGLIGGAVSTVLTPMIPLAVAGLHRGWRTQLVAKNAQLREGPCSDPPLH